MYLPKRQQSLDSIEVFSVDETGCDYKGGDHPHVSHSLQESSESLVDSTIRSSESQFLVGT